MSGYIFKGIEISMLQRHLHCSTSRIKRPLTDGWRKEMWYKHLMEYYSAIKKKDVLLCAAT
jgi:hypothetical protein